MRAGVYTCVGVCLLRVVGWLEIVAERVCMCAAIVKSFFEPLLGLLSKALFPHYSLCHMARTETLDNADCLSNLHSKTNCQDAMD